VHHVGHLPRMFKRGFNQYDPQLQVTIKDTRNHISNENMYSIMARQP